MLSSNSQSIHPMGIPLGYVAVPIQPVQQANQTFNTSLDVSNYSGVDPFGQQPSTSTQADIDPASELMPMMFQMIQVMMTLLSQMQGMTQANNSATNTDTSATNAAEAGNSNGCHQQAVAPNTDDAATDPTAADTNTQAAATRNTGGTDTATDPAPTSADTTTAATDKVGASKTAVKQPANSIDVMKLGAKGDGSADDQAIIQKALDQAAADPTNKTVWLPPGTYSHSDVLKVPSGVTLTGAGDSTVLKATNASKAAIELTGTKSALSNVKVTSNAATRIPNAEASNVWVNHADGASVTNVSAIGSGANSVTVDRSTNSVIDHVLGVGSNADGIAINNGSTNNTIQNSVVRESGDDSFSDDSYKDDEIASSGNKFLNNLSVDNRYGDNYKFAGAANDTIEGNVSLGGPKGGIVIIQDNDSGTKASTGNVAKNNVAIDLSAPTVSAFMNPGGDNNVYMEATDSKAKKYIEMANETSGNYDYNKSYVAGTGPGANNRGGVHLYTT